MSFRHVVLVEELGCGSLLPSPPVPQPWVWLPAVCAGTEVGLAVCQCFGGKMRLPSAL